MGVLLIMGRCFCMLACMLAACAWIRSSIMRLLQRFFKLVHGMQMFLTISDVWQDPPEQSGSGTYKTFTTANLKPHPMLPVLQLMA